MQKIRLTWLMKQKDIKKAGTNPGFPFLQYVKSYCPATRLTFRVKSS